ncbi:B12-binding domain-containing radical SAM protein [Zavarzinia compransoris]|nr:radical SAM protein [Zavarzinia compransoris]TDP46009.1 radical SAM superfamily enzyme YgiQ (UPF0313 family) [Zavarzinia compransoris]
MPSNSMACVAGIVQDAIDRQLLGPEVTIRYHWLDETHSKVDPARIMRAARKAGARLLIFMVGVQSNMFPRAVDLARPFLAAGHPVCVGGFHVSGIVSMLKTMPPDLVEAQALGISFFAGEAEDGRIDQVIRDGYAGTLAPLYNFIHDQPNLAGAALPVSDKRELRRMIYGYSTADLGRGCPFECSFCTIINVQGRKSRFRTPDDLEAIVRRNVAEGISGFFLTDDNFARNRGWEGHLDRLIALRAEGIRVRLVIQVDTLAHRIPNFIDKCVAAGADQIFIGLENINADSLESTKKRQNRVEEYRDMFLAWKKHPVLITCGYIIGFPNDTKESILRDIEVIKTQMPIDFLYINYLTPLPGCEDHKKLLDAGVWMDPDMSKYDLNHRVTHHPRMSDAEWEEAFIGAHRSFYEFAHLKRIMQRMVALRIHRPKMLVHRLLGYRESVLAENVAMLESGIVRIRRRRQRRHGLPLESPFVFYPRMVLQALRGTGRMWSTFARLKWLMFQVRRAPDRLAYSDAAIGGSDAAANDALLTATRTTAHARRRAAGAVKAP